MERRELLRMGGMLGVATLGGGAGCLPNLLPRRVPEAEIKTVLGAMDKTLERVSRYDMLDDFARQAGTPNKYSATDRALSRTSIRALYTSAMFRSLPEDAQLHPAVQERMFGELTAMDEAVYGMTDRMSMLNVDRRAAIKAALRDKRTEPETIGQLFDRNMGAVQMPIGRRFQVRSIFKQVGWRMQKQPTAVIDEYVTKVTKATARVGSQVELQRRIAAQIGQEAYWRHQNRLALMLVDDPNATGGGGSGGTAAAPPVVIVPPNTSESAALMTNVRFAAERNQCETVEFLGKRIAEIDPETYRSIFLTDPGVIACKQSMRERAAVEANRPRGPGGVEPCEDPRSLANAMARKKVIGTGGWMLGIGLISGVLGAVLVGGGEGAAVLGAVGLTVGAACLIGGLIVLIVGAGMASS
jgi:hypothetical protein